MGNSKKKEKAKCHISSTQEVLYNREFKRADRAAGYHKPTI